MSEAKQQWYILRGEMKYGPYDYSVLINMLQRGEVQDYNYVWAPHLEKWTLIGELADFSKDRLTIVMNSHPELKQAFLQRQFDRLDLKTSIYGHNEHQFFDGETISVSENGALALLNTPLLLPGQEILLHFRQSEANSVAFNTIARIVRKNFSKQRINVHSGLHYAVRFEQLPKFALEQIKHLIQTQKLQSIS